MSDLHAPAGERLEAMLATCCECAHYPDLDRCPPCEARAHIVALTAEIERLRERSALAQSWLTEALELAEEEGGKLYFLIDGARVALTPE